MQELLLIAVGAAFVNNVVLSQFLGICPFLGVSKNVKTAAGMGGAVVFVITIASFVTGLIYKFILGNPKILGGELQYLNTIVFILVIAALVQFVEMFLKKEMPPLYIATAVGFTISIVLMAGIREKIAYNDIPKSFQGFPTVLLTAGLMAIAFCGFSGLI